MVSNNVKHVILSVFPEKRYNVNIELAEKRSVSTYKFG